MNLDYKYLLDGSFHPSSCVWIYQGSRLLTVAEALEIEGILQRFVAGWKSHGDPVKGAGYLFFGQFIILVADTSRDPIGGCSTDESVRLMKELEQRYGIRLFDRTTLAFVVKDRIELLPLSQLDYAFANGFITGDTLYFNNVIQTLEELKSRWIIPARESWLASRLPAPQPS
jgi:hypothetical protein